MVIRVHFIAISSDCKTLWKTIGRKNRIPRDIIAKISEFCRTRRVYLQHHPYDIDGFIDAKRIEGWFRQSSGLLF